MKRLVLVFLVLVAVAWWLAFARPRVAQAPRAPAPVAAPEPAPEAEPPPPPPPSPVDAAVAAPAPPQEIQPDPALRARAPDTRGFTDALEQTFASDAADPSASSAEAALRRLLWNDGLGSSALRSLECRKTVCKLALRWTLADDAAYRRFVERLQADNAKFLATRAQEPDAQGVVLV